MPDGLDKLAGGIGKAIEQVPQLYEDGLQPATQETGKILGRVPRAINAVFAGLDCWILKRENKVEETKVLLEQKLKNVNPDNIVAPEPYVAVPAIQAISYSMDSNELRELYANLLAKSMNKDTKGDVHPSFVEVIKQMSPNDAAYFKLLASVETRIVADIKGYKSDNVIYNFIRRNANFFSNTFGEESVNISIDNLSRLELINVSEKSANLDSIEQYKKIMKQFEETYNTIKYPTYKTIKIIPKAINITNFGELFNSICVEEL